MGKAVTLARTETGRPSLEPAPDDRAALRAMITREYCGGLSSELWLRPARQAAARIVEVIYVGRSQF